MAIKQIRVPAALFGAVVLWILLQNATWTPDWLHHPIWQMAADALDKPIDGSISVNRDLTTLALLRLITAASVFWIAFNSAEMPRGRTFCSGPLPRSVAPMLLMVFSPLF